MLSGLGVVNAKMIRAFVTLLYFKTRLSFLLNYHLHILVALLLTHWSSIFLYAANKFLSASVNLTFYTIL